MCKLLCIKSIYVIRTSYFYTFFLNGKKTEREEERDSCIIVYSLYNIDPIGVRSIKYEMIIMYV